MRTSQVLITKKLFLGLAAALALGVSASAAPRAAQSGRPPRPESSRLIAGSGGELRNGLESGLAATGGGVLCRFKPVAVNIGGIWSTSGIIGATATIPRNAMVKFEASYAGWGVSGQTLKTFQLTLDPAGLSSGGGTALTRPHVACTDPAGPNSPQCNTAMAAFGAPQELRCNNPFAGECNNFWQETLRATQPPFDYITGFGLPACAQPQMTCGDTTFGPGTFDTAGERYAFSAVLFADAGAAGTYTLQLDPLDPFLGANFLQLGDGSLLPIQKTIPAQIIVRLSCCLPNGACALPVDEAACAALGGILAPAPCPFDIDQNNIDDVCGGDCDNNGTLDPFEPLISQKDCDFDGICNGVEISGCVGVDPECQDCNVNGVPDGCEPDCNNNDVADACDIASGVSEDCSGNGIPDECELGACCLNTIGDNSVYEGCIETSEPACTAASGIFRGVCKHCPTQNVSIILEPGGGVFVHAIGAPIDCIAGTSLAARGPCPPGGPFTDAWVSDANASMCHNFGAAGQSIPADFFDPGSDMVTSSLCLKGLSLGIPGFGNADTLVERSADPFDRCELPSAAQSTVDVFVTALSLVDTTPLIVTYNGGQTPEQWNVAVDLSAAIPPPPIGSLTAVKTHCNGGTYTSLLNVQPRFTFTKVGDPAQIRVLDTGLDGIPYVALDQQTPAPWVHDVDPNLGLSGDACTQFHPGIDDQVHLTACDCNANLTRDKCDIEQGASVDCNLNEVPDSCDLFICDDSNPCTDDVCTSGVGCEYPNNALPCNDGDACTTIDTCSAGGCVGGSPLNCDDGQFCNGVETCNPSSGCVNGTNPCPPDNTCDEVGDVCVPPPSNPVIPTVSGWGLVIMTLVLLAGAKVYFARHEAATPL